MEVTKAAKVELVETLAVTPVVEEILINKLAYLKGVEIRGVEELILADRQMLHQELVKALVDLVMVKDQDKVLDKV